MRDRFEKWAKKFAWFDATPDTKERDDNVFVYADASTDCAWLAWQARAHDCF